MVNKIIFENEITLWWDFDAFLNATEYKVYLNGVYHGKTEKTHYTFSGLNADCEYRVRVEAVNRCDGCGEEEMQIRTNRAKRRIDVTKAPYFAVGDGKTLNTTALQRALDDCRENDCVYVPKGVYITGALNMHGDSELYVEKDGVLQGTENPEDYLPKIKSRFEGTEDFRYRSLINIGNLDANAGYTTKNIVIRGEGTIFGGGAPLDEAIRCKERQLLQNFLEENADYVKTCDNQNTISGRVRGRLINISNCKNVVISGLTLGYAASWNVHFVYSKNIVTYGCKILSDVLIDENGTVIKDKVHNGDGWDPDSSEDCVCFDTVFDTYDDGIAIKSGKNNEGWLVGRPTRNVRIFDCRGKNGVAIGSELSGGIENVYVWDCDFFNGIVGAVIKTTRKRGGYVRNVKMINCKLADIRIAADYRCNDDGESNVKELTAVENVSFENVEVKGVFPYLNKRERYFFTVYLCGFDEPEYYFENLHFKNVNIYERENKEMQTIKIKNVKNLTMENVTYVSANE